MSYSKMDKISTLATLKLNKGNKSKTAREMGVDRKTVISWEKQLESDRKLFSHVQAATLQLADLEELQAIKASMELSRRLDDRPDEIDTTDLIRLKDSGIKNSRLIRGDVTSINETRNSSPEQIVIQFIQWQVAQVGCTEAQAAEFASTWPQFRELGVPDEVRDRVVNLYLKEGSDRT